MMRVPPAYKSGNAGQVVNPVKEQTLGDYITRKEKQYIEDERNKLSDYERGYQDGYYDAIVDGAKK